MPDRRDFAAAIKLSCGAVVGISKATAEEMQKIIDSETGDTFNTRWPLALTREGSALTPEESVLKSLATMEIGQPLVFSGDLYIPPERDGTFVVVLSEVKPGKP